MNNSSIFWFVLLVAMGCLTVWEGIKLWRGDFASFSLSVNIKPGSEAAVGKYFAVVLFCISASAVSQFLVLPYPSLRSILYIPFPLCGIAAIAGFKRYRARI